MKVWAVISADPEERPEYKGCVSLFGDFTAAKRCLENSVEEDSETYCEEPIWNEERTMAYFSERGVSYRLEFVEVRGLEEAIPNLSKVVGHYWHAKEKHPYFCDWVAPERGVSADSMRYIRSELAKRRKCVEGAAKRNILGWDDLLDCELWETLEALAESNKPRAVEEIYDMVAILLRTVDALEGLQKLGKPSKEGEQQ